MRRIIILLAFFLLSCETNFKKEKTENNLPKSLESAVEYIVSDLSAEDKIKVKETKFCNLIMYHHGWGTGIRNSLGLWRGNTELLKSACGGERCHPDDASMEIIYGVWNKLKDTPIRHKPNKEDNCEPDWLNEIVE
ncbi:MAG: DUF6794 domain-containing protein [Pseudomonadota bacterium]